MDTDLAKQHDLLKAQSQRFAAKVSPLILASGLLQEAMGLHQALVNHADLLKSKLETQHETPEQNGGSV